MDERSDRNAIKHPDKAAVHADEHAVKAERATTAHCHRCGPTVSMLAFTESIGEVERSTAKATANWATRPKIQAGNDTEQATNEGEGDDQVR